ncbi:peptidase A4 family-domain-containing protein [Xylariaceae sp. FL1272]|nr:peptidase A4 family-domain-containing protein [Xylariaceae sp. FL1272]
MKSAIVAGALFATGALAAPGTASRWANHAKRADARKGNLRQAAEHPDIEVYNKDGSIRHVEYSSNWAGAVLTSTGWTSVLGTITVPTPVNTGKSGAGSAWVGIDGDTCGTAILQTGIDWYITASGSVSYDAWYEWYPDYAYDFTGITISKGDSVKFTVVANSKSSGTATINNLTTGKSVSHTFTGETSAQLCEYDAEWIVEDFESGGSQVQFADFGTVTFTSPQALKGSTVYTPSGATIIDIEQSNSVLTSCSASSSQVTCTYT